MPKRRTILDNHRVAAGLPAGIYRVHVSQCSGEMGCCRIEADGNLLADLSIEGGEPASKVILHPGGQISLVCDPDVELSVEIEIPL